MLTTCLRAALAATAACAALASLSGCGGMPQTAEEFRQAVPGAMLWVGNGPGEGGCGLHNSRYDFNDDALPIGVSFSSQ